MDGQGHEQTPQELAMESNSSQFWIDNNNNNNDSSNNNNTCVHFEKKKNQLWYLLYIFSILNKQFWMNFWTVYSVRTIVIGCFIFHSTFNRGYLKLIWLQKESKQSCQYRTVSFKIGWNEEGIWWYPNDTQDLWRSNLDWATRKLVDSWRLENRRT